MSDRADMQELFKEAAKVAAVVPESMQEAAFHRALDVLMGDTNKAATKQSTASRRGERKRASRGEKEGTSQDDRVARVTAISRDDAHEVDKETSALGRSIALLVVASREADVDGLTAPEIAQILTEKFRHRTTRQAVQSALDAAGNMVDRHKPGNSAALYRVMRRGEEWLGKPVEERAASGGSRRRAGAKTAARASAPKNAANAKKSRSTKKAAAASRSSGATRRTGPKGAVEVLISEGFFKEPRGIADIRQELRDQKALTYASTDLSPGLTRLLREGKLKRSKTEKQYVYSAG